jgi:hypothetical protein
MAKCHCGQISERLVDGICLDRLIGYVVGAISLRNNAGIDQWILAITAGVVVFFNRDVCSVLDHYERDGMVGVVFSS